MKIAAIILSMIVFLLSVIPCCAGDDCNDGVNTEQTSGYTGECSICSPFLSCGTCTGFANTSTILTYHANRVDHRCNPVPFCELVTERLSHQIWQPPRAH